MIKQTLSSSALILAVACSGMAYAPAGLAEGFNPMKMMNPSKWMGGNKDDDDYYSQPRALFNLMSPDQQKALFENTARAMGDAPREIKIRHIGNCLKADEAYGKGVADALGISVDEAK